MTLGTLQARHMAELILLLMALIGLALNLVGMSIAAQRVQEIQRRGLNGLYGLIARAHRRDEVIRIVMTLILIGVAIMMFTSHFITARLLLMVLSVLITFKSYLLAQDRFHIRLLQTTKRQRATDCPSSGKGNS